MFWALLAIWILIPASFFLMALWSWLEQSTLQKRGKKKNREPKDLLNQALFVTGCSGVAYLVDTFVIESGSIDFIFGPWVPKPLIRFCIYPFILYVAAMTVGGTKAPKIDTAPRPSERYKPRNR